MAFTLHGHHIPGSDPTDRPKDLPEVHCGGINVCRMCNDQRWVWQLNADKCVNCHAQRVDLIQSICTDCGRDWMDHFNSSKTEYLRMYSAE